MGNLLKGMTVLAYSEDPVAAAKAVEAFTKDNKKLVVLGGAMGATPLDEAGVKAVASMPSREELIASIVACIGAPGSQLVAAIGAPAANIAGDPHHARGAGGGIACGNQRPVRKTLIPDSSHPYLNGT